MQLTDVLCYVLLTITMAVTCIQAESEMNDVEERNLHKRTSRTATLIVDSAAPVGRMFQKPKVLYRKISKKRHAAPGATYGPRRTKYGPTRTLKKPGKKFRSKGNSKHVSSHKKRAPKPSYGPPKRPTMKPVYGPPKISSHRLNNNNIGFGEPLHSFSHNKYRPPKSKQFIRPQSDSPSKPEFDNDFTSKPEFDGDYSSNPNIGIDFSSPTSFSNEFSNKPFGDEFSTRPRFSNYQNTKQRFEEPPVDSYSKDGYGEPPLNSYVPKQGYGEPPLDSYDPNPGYAEPPVDSYGAPIQSNLHDLTFSTAQSFSDPTSHSSKDYSFGSGFVPWNNVRDQKPDNSFVYYQKLSPFDKPEAEVFVTPIPNKQQHNNEELQLNSYSDIYNFRQAKDKKKNYFENVKMLNQPWKGEKMKKESNEEIIVGGQYAEPPARYVPKFQPSAPMLNNDENEFSPALHFPNRDESATISSYVNYKNSNMAFSPQNLNDVFSIVDK